MKGPSSVIFLHWVTPQLSAHAMATKEPNKHSSESCMCQLECLHAMDENVTHPIPYFESTPTPSHMLFSKCELLSFSNDNHFPNKGICFIF